MVFCHYYKDLVRIPDNIEVYNITGDWFLFATKEFRDTSRWGSEWGQKVHPLSAEVLAYFMRHHKATSVESRTYAEFIRMANDDTDRDELFRKLYQLTEQKNGLPQTDFKEVSFDMGDGDSVKITATCLSFNSEKAYEKYVGAIERGE